MRILQLMAGASTGGAEKFFVRLVAALAEAGIHQQAIIRPHPGRRLKLEDCGVIVHEARYGGMLDPFTKFRVKKLARAFGPDIVMSWMNRASTLAPAGPWINVGRLGGYYDLKYYKKCDYLICNTADVRAYVVGSGWPEDKVVHLPNFVDEQISPPVDRARFDTPAASPLIVCCGRLHPNKAFDVAIDAISRVADAHLWIAGDGPLAGQLQERARALSVLERVRFLGWQEDVSAIHAAADLFVCPSRHEPLGNVILEAWAYGTPVIAAASQGPAGLIDDGVNGVLVPVDDPETMAGAIRRLLEDRALAERLKEAGRETYFKRFSRAVVVKKYTDFFGALCPGA